MAEERATAGHDFWSYKYGVLPTEGQRYLNWRYRKCASFVTGKTIADIPSGEGLGLRYFSKAISITCVDYDLSAVETARTQSSNVTSAIAGDMRDLPLESSSLDCITSLEGLEHLDKRDGAKFIAEVHRVVRDGGLFLLSCPVIDGVIHSGNEFHLHEWDLDSLLSLVSYGFDIEEVHHYTGFSQAVLLVCHRKDVAIPMAKWMEFLDQMGTESLKETFSNVTRWLDESKSEMVSVGLDAQSDGALLPTCFRVLAVSNITGNTKGAEKKRLVDWIQSQQDEEGWFCPGELRRADLSSHSATYLRMQATYFAIHALDVLKTKPLKSIRFVEKLRDIAYLEGWLDGGPWQNPWLHSNNIMFALCFLQLDGNEYGNEESMKAFDFILDYLDGRQDPETGLWQPDDEPDIPNAVFAAYHFFPYYFWRGRRPGYVERIIDSTLSIQKSDGLFIKNGGACEDLDAVHTLVMMNLVTDYRAEDVKRSLERCFWRLLQIQNCDGGFPNSVRKPVRATWKRRLLENGGLLRFVPERHRHRGLPPIPKWQYSGWEKLSCNVGASDMWSAWFRPLSLKLIAETIDGIELPGMGEYRRLPGLGWHDAARISDCAGKNERTPCLKGSLKAE